MVDRVFERAKAITNHVFMPAVWPQITSVHERSDVARMTEAQRTIITDTLIEGFYEPLMQETINYREWLWDSGRRDEATVPAPPAPPPPPEILEQALSAARSAA